jgi:hypothetical protein
MLLWKKGLPSLRMTPCRCLGSTRVHLPVPLAWATTPMLAHACFRSSFICNTVPCICVCVHLGSRMSLVSGRHRGASNPLGRERRCPTCSSECSAEPCVRLQANIYSHHPAGGIPSDKQSQDYLAGFSAALTATLP